VTRRLTADVTESPNPNIRSGEFYSDHFGDYYPDLDSGLVCAARRLTDVCVRCYRQERLCFAWNWIGARPRVAASTQRLSEDVAINCATYGRITGIEAPDISETVFRSGAEPRVETQNLVAVAAW